MRGLTDIQFRVLIWLKRCKEPATPELVAGMQPQSSMISPSRIRGILKAMQKKGFVVSPPYEDGVVRFLPSSGKIPE